MARNQNRILVFLLVSLSLSLPSAFSQEKIYDYVIQDATVFDGKSLHGVESDIGILGDSIALVGDIPAEEGREVISAKGFLLAPGFIDAHTHSDFNPLVYPELSNKAAQGVTTEVVGNCGMSGAPVLGRHGEWIYSVWAREGVQVPPAAVTWDTFKGYRAALELAGLKHNFVGLVGHGNLRSAVAGLSPRTATADEIRQMKNDLAQAMDEGAAGISFGLVYLPGIFADREEITELCAVAGRRGGVCAFHMRSEGSDLTGALREVLEIGEKTGARIQVSHLKAAGREHWDKIQEAFRVIEEARAKGIRVEADAYPYEAGYAELGVVLPGEFYKREDRVSYFQDPSKREELLKRLREYDAQGDFHWDRVMVASSAHPEFEKYEGKFFSELAAETGKRPEEFLVDLLAGTSFEVSAFYFSQSLDVVKQVLTQPYVAVGSDSVADGTRKPHPRCFGSFPRILKWYVEQERKGEATLPILGDVIRKMTSLPAEQFGIERRGYLSAGYFADLVLFDPETVSDQADYQTPTAPNNGILWVFVNGKPVVRNGQVLPGKPGLFLGPES